MLARTLAQLPEPAAGTPGYSYEPKWDGLRALVFRDGEQVTLASRSGRELGRYFPELVAACRDQLPERVVLDGEILLAGEAGGDFAALLARLHPAVSRVQRLARELPAVLAVFDLLALGEENLLGEPQRRRRELLERFRDWHEPILVSPATTEPAVARAWFAQLDQPGFDGIIAKPRGEPYRPGERAMFKIKRRRSAECVVAGLRWSEPGTAVASLLLGLYDGAARLHYVGAAAGLPAAERRALAGELAPLAVVTGHPWLEPVTGPEPVVAVPGGRSRWSQGRDAAFVALRPERVVEVTYDQVSGRRFRHVTTVLRWRPDRRPHSCLLTQLVTPG